MQMSLLIKYFGDFKITVITTESIKLYPGEVAEELKASSLCHRIRFIKSLFKWAQEEKYVLINPVSTIKEPKPESRIPKFLTEEEIELLREALKQLLRKLYLNLCIQLAVG